MGDDPSNQLKIYINKMIKYCRKIAHFGFPLI